MKLILRIVTTLLALYSSICLAAPITTNIPIFNGGLNQTAIFKNGAQATQHCLQPTIHDAPNCLIQYYKNHGASPQAIKFLKLTQGYIQKMNSYGGLTVILANVVAGDHNQAVYLVNTQGDFLDPGYLNQAVESTVQKLLNQNVQYQALIKKNNQLFFMNNDLSPQVNTNNAGNVSVIFNYRIASCVACAGVAFAKIAFNFDKAGNFQNITLAQFMLAGS